MSYYISYIVNLLITYGVLFLLFRYAVKKDFPVFPLALVLNAALVALHFHWGWWLPLRLTYSLIHFEPVDLRDAAYVMVAGRLFYINDGILITSFVWLMHGTFDKWRALITRG